MRRISGLVVFALALSVYGWAQYPPRSTERKNPATKDQTTDVKDADRKTRDKTMTAEPTASSGKYSMTAKLVDPELKAKKKEATVQVAVGGIKMMDPAAAKEQPRAGQGHIHYQVDDGPVIATTATKLSFHELKPGNHRIQVTLVGNDHNKLGPEQTLEVTVPSGGPTS